MPPLVSVLIPTLNRFDTVKAAISSVLKQSFQDFEIVVIDDGSTDPIASLCELFPKTRVVAHGVNKGISIARNTGIMAALGKYIAFLDSDDEWLPEKLAKQVEWMESQPEMGACTSGYYYYTEEGNSVVIPKQQRDWFRTLASGTTLAPGTTLFAKTDAMRTVPYDPSFPRLVDLDWALRFVKLYPLSVYPEPLAVVYRNSRPSANSVETANLMLVKKYRQEFLSLGHFYGHYCIGKRWLEVATHYYREGNRAKGQEYLWKALRENPIQRPGMYVRILDYLLGTSFIRGAKKIRQAILWRKLE